MPRPQPLYPQERHSTRYIGGWVGPRSGLDMYGKFCPIGIWSPDCPVCSESLPTELSQPTWVLKRSLIRFAGRNQIQTVSPVTGCSSCTRWPSKKKALCSFQTSWTTHPTRRLISGDLNPQLKCCANLKSSRKFSLHRQLEDLFSAVLSVVTHTHTHTHT